MEGKMERLSTQTQESGFVSMHSQRSSSQSYTASSMTSKRCSQQSSVSYNSQSFSTQQQSFSQQKLSECTEGSVMTQRTTSSKSSLTTASLTGNGDPALLEKLVNVGVVCFSFFYSNTLLPLNFLSLFFFQRPLMTRFRALLTRGPWLEKLNYIPVGLIG